MINGHTTPIFVENSHERPFSMTLKANTYGVFVTPQVSVSCYVGRFVPKANAQ
jgi:hypothetical protein